ncbi:MAG: hypothetical protein N2Z22_04015, partial [Turneriella sp.]|nr:hypothetical protein [Turneriella sp.]
FNSIPTAPNAKPNHVIGQMSNLTNAFNCFSAMPSQHCLAYPAGLSIRAGRLAVADYANHRVLIFALPIAFSYPAATHVLGQPNFSSATPSTSQTGLYHPAAVFLDKSHIWISDSDNNRLVVWQLP